MISFLLTGLVCAVALVSFAAACWCAIAVIRVLLVVRALVAEQPRAEARDRWRSALKGRW